MTKQDRFYRKLQENFKRRLNESTILTPDNIIDYVEDVELSQIDTKDAPDFSDAFIDSAILNIDGKERDATEQELEWLNNNPDFIHNRVEKQLY